MQFRVYPLRLRGRRLTWRDVRNGPSYVGELLTHERQSKAGRFIVATLHDPLNHVAGPLLPDLYEPVLTGFSPLAFRLRGIERHDSPEGPIAVIQEWHCEFN